MNPIKFFSSSYFPSSPLSNKNFCKGLKTILLIIAITGIIFVSLKNMSPTGLWQSGVALSILSLTALTCVKFFNKNWFKKCIWEALDNDQEKTLDDLLNSAKFLSTSNCCCFNDVTGGDTIIESPLLNGAIYVKDIEKKIKEFILSNNNVFSIDKKEKWNLVLAKIENNIDDCMVTLSRF